MNKTKAIMFVAFVLAMGAGVAVGMLGARSLPSSAKPEERQGDPGSWLVKELQLTPDQADKMRAIWNDLLRTKGPQYGEEFKALQQQRESAVTAIMTASQQEQCKKVDEDFAQKARDVWKRMEQDFSAAAERTRQLLNESQRPKYDALIARFRAEHQSPDGFPGMGSMGGYPSGRGMGSKVPKTE